MVHVLPDKNSVYVNGVIYKLRSIKIFKDPAPFGNTCFNCVAYRDLSLCDTICMYCTTEKVFGRGKDA